MSLKRLFYLIHTQTNYKKLKMGKTFYKMYKQIANQNIVILGYFSHKNQVLDNQSSFIVKKLINFFLIFSLLSLLHWMMRKVAIQNGKKLK